jgi:hypothetical protein
MVAEKEKLSAAAKGLPARLAQKKTWNVVMQRNRRKAMRERGKESTMNYR